MCTDPISTETGSSLKRHPTHPGRSWFDSRLTQRNPDSRPWLIDPTCHPANGSKFLLFVQNPQNYHPRRANFSSRNVSVTRPSLFSSARTVFCLQAFSLPRRCRIPINLHKIQSTLHPLSAHCTLSSSGKGLNENSADG